MPDNDFEKLEQALVRVGRSIQYPPTPALAARVRARSGSAKPRFRWRPAFVLAMAVLVACALLVALPGTRDALAQLLSLRTILIIPVTPTPTGTATSATPAPPTVAMPTQSVQCCEVTLAEAQARSRFKILLPPDESPSHVYLQEIRDFGTLNPQQVVLVFGPLEAPRRTIYEATGFLYGKLVSGGTVVAETRVRGVRALWLAGAPHLLVALDPVGRQELGPERSVSANTLVWEIGELTYRIETNSTLDEAVRIAESLK